ncbi:MAG: hypothetical protein SF182_25385 [Deltaproteobacteria bacterium]|nr:hypothetical protein [Deltaproteobacteria bacterium]
MRRRAATRSAAVLLAALLVLAGCGASRSAAPPVWEPPPFLITFWCAPPLDQLDDARLAEIAAAGFTTVGAPCEGDFTVAANRRVLAAAARHDLRVWVADHRLYEAAAGALAATDVAPAVVADYGAAPALDGYVVADEPPAERFAGVAAVVGALRAADPARLAYVNLLPIYIPPPLLGSDSYDAYLAQFVAEARPQLLSVDHYPFGHTRDRSTFFANLAALRDAALRADLPFLWIVLAMPHGPYRDPTEAELAWQVFHAIAYGARGVSYFAYWTPAPADWDFHHGLIENGQPTRHYGEAARINARARAIGSALRGWRSLAVADAQGEVATPLPIGPLAGIDGGPITVGLFGDGRGGLAALLVNRDYREPVVATLRLRAGADPPQALDAADSRWREDPGLVFPLAPGQAQLLRWSSP